MGNYTVSKSQITVYRLRLIKGSGYWADITIDEGKESGRIQIASDYGAYQYYWGCCGKSFKQFLTEVEIDYVARKFGVDDYFYLDKTLNSYRRQLLQARRDEDIDSEYARDIWDEIESLTDYDSKDSFVSQMWHQGKLMEFMDHTPDMVTDITPMFLRFWKEVWPEFIAVIKDELLTESEVSND